MLGIEFSSLTLDVLGAATTIFALRVCDVSLGTLRYIMIARNKRRVAAILGFFEVTIWVVAISQVVTHLGNIWMILGYSGGYGAGTALGMWIEEKTSTGHVQVRIVSHGEGQKITQRLRDKGSRVVEFEGAEEDTTTHILSAVTTRKKLPRILREIQFIDPHAMITVEDLRMAKIPMPAR
jgi:uncharacterized protein YebE (UPF0316 family)